MGENRVSAVIEFHPCSAAGQWGKMYNWGRRRKKRSA